MKFVPDTVEFAKTHDQWLPFIGVYIMAFFLVQDIVMKIDPNYFYFDRGERAVGRSEIINIFDNCFELYGTLGNARRAYHL